MSRILITTFGSYGDLYPYLAIGAALLRRGHHVTLATSSAYREKAEAEGLAFAPVRPDVDLGDREFLEYIFDARRGSERILRAVSDLIRDTYEDTLGPASEADVILTHPLTFAATLIAKKQRKKWVSTVLAPVNFISVYDPPVAAQAPWLRHLNFLGPNLYRLVWGIGQRQVLQWAKPVVKFGERELGLTPKEIGHPLFAGSFSPLLNLALFSPTFAPPQSDWPPETVTTGFPFHDRAGRSNDLDPKLEQFLSVGPPPVVFTLGSSAVGAAGDFYRNSYEAVASLGVRTLFLTGAHPQGLPENLPSNMLEWPYAPHSALFPRASVVVHQGGVGTTAEALRSGRPMLVVPFAHDQFDNAERCHRLGVGSWLDRASYTRHRAERVIRELAGSQAVQKRCAEVASHVRSERGAEAAADAIVKITSR